MDKKKILFILILLVLPFFVMALENEYPAIGGTQPTDDTSPAEFLKYIFNLGILFGVIAAVFVIISQGATMLMSKGETALVILAKENIKRVFVGLLILLGAYVILTAINPDLKVIKFSPLEVFENIINGPGTEEETYPLSEFEEIPLGSILESILAANSSERIYDDKTEELCYAYDENGDTIDRNDDKKIDEKDLLKGMDMYYCLSELNKAIIKKIKDLNGGNSLCDNIADGGPIEEMKNLITSGCSCSSCDVWKPNVYCPGEECYQCKTYSCGECSTCCRDHCSCCGKAYYAPDLGCQEANDKTKDPCGSVRDGIDCARNEIRLRVNGTGFSVPGAAEDQCAFTEYFKENEYKFLTLNKAKERINSFKSYFQNHLADLRKAKSMMKSPYGERISAAEFKAIQASDQYKKTVAKEFPNTNSDYSYNTVKYCRDFNCTAYRDGDEKNLCVSGERADLTQALMEKEKLIDPLYDKQPQIIDKRVCEVSEDIESYSYDGDGATFYFQAGYQTKTTSKQEECSIDSGVEKETAKSLIPIGETVDATEKFAQDVLTIVSQIADETQKTVEKALELSTLSEQCNCGWGCSNESDCHCSTSEEGCTSCGCSSCRACEANSQALCICCQDCVEVETPVGEGISDPQKDMIDNFGTCPSCPAIYSTGNENEYWTYCPCSGTLLIPNTSLINNPNSQFCYMGGELGSYCSTHFQEETCQTEFKKLPFTCIISRVNAPKFVNYAIESCETASQNPVSDPMLCAGGQKIYYTEKSILKLRPKGETTLVCEGQMPVDQGAVSALNGHCHMDWVSDDEFVLTDYFCKGPMAPYDPQGLIWFWDISPYNSSVQVALPSGYQIVSVEAIPSVTGADSVQYYHPPTACSNIIKDGKPIYCIGEGYDTYHFIREGYSLRFKVINTNKRKPGETDNQAYYVCPFGDMKDRQCRIFKYSSAVDSDYPENINTDYDCRNENSSGAGYLQKIELLNDRLENLVQGKNLRDDDINRWTLLEKLSLSRKKLDSCIQGYGFSYKEDLTKQRIFSCQEGIDATILNSLVVLPDFPYPQPGDYWNCYPLNSSSLTADQKKSCYANKDAEGTETDPQCQRLIKDMMDNYYCCQGE